VCIERILIKRGVRAGGRVFDTLIPLPFNSDACLQAIGIEDFDDIGDRWDADFCNILEKLVDGEEFSVVTWEPQTGVSEIIESARLSDITGYLAYVDHVDFVIVLSGRRITFTRGHEILWLEGFSQDRINTIPFPIETTDNGRIAELF
jgi:hypothetical protein